MPARNPLLTWIVVSVFILSVASTPLVYRWRHQPAASPRTPTELKEILACDCPGLHVAAEREDHLDSGMYISTCRQPREKLLLLQRNAKVAGKWQGVVYCEKVGALAVIEDPEFQSWGEYGMQIGSLLFFGDPELLQCIRNVLLIHQSK